GVPPPTHQPLRSSELGKATRTVVPQLFFAFLAASGGFLVFLLPETNNRKIPDTLQEASEIAR
ncbi:unnamed protein product, partial [Larinioides sclopetarius]